jgi:lipoprotein-releasing system permease protein
MIGILKSMGASNFQIKNIFLINVSYLISVGLLIGNIFGLLLLYIQKTYKLIKLDPEIYYTSSVPVSIDIETVIMLNLFTFIICLLSVLIPSYIISKISPIKSIKFQ